MEEKYTVNSLVDLSACPSITHESTQLHTSKNIRDEYSPSQVAHTLDWHVSHAEAGPQGSEEP